MISIATALIAAGYTNIMNYIQVLFSVFNAPLFATFFIGMFWKRMTPGRGSGAWWPAASARSAPTCSTRRACSTSAPTWPRRSGAAIVAFSLDAVVTVGVTFVTEPRPVEELEGLVYGMANDGEEGQGGHGLVPLARILASRLA